MKSNIFSSLYDAMRRTDAAAERAGLKFNAELNSDGRFSVYLWDAQYISLYSKTVYDLSDDNIQDAFAALGYASGYIQAHVDAQEAAAMPDNTEVEFGPLEEVKTEAA